MNEPTPTVEELAMGERKFLHDISNHILVAHGMANLVLKAAKNSNTLEAKELERLEKTVEAINKMTALLKERRALLHEITV